MSATLTSLIVCALIGALLGYAGAFMEYTNERDHGAEYSSWEFEWLGVVALPGKLLASLIRSYDYRLTEAWIIDKHRIASLNAIVFLPLGFFIRKRITNKC